MGQWWWSDSCVVGKLFSDDWAAGTHYGLRGEGGAVTKTNERKDCLADYSSFQPLPAHLWLSPTYEVIGGVLGQIRSDFIFNDLWRLPGMGQGFPALWYMDDCSERASILVLCSFGGSFGSWLKHSHCRHLLFICIWSRGVSSNHVSWTIMNSESESPGSSVRPAHFRIVLTDPPGEMSGEWKKGRRGRVISYLVVGDTMFINGNYILTSLPPTSTPHSSWVWSRKIQWRKELIIIHSWARKITPSPPLLLLCHIANVTSDSST